MLKLEASFILRIVGVLVRMGGSVKRLALYFCSGHDLMVCDLMVFALGSVLTGWSLLRILSLFLSVPSPPLKIYVKNCFQILKKRPVGALLQ